MKKIFKCLILGMGFALFAPGSQAQLLKKLKEKAQKAVEKKVVGEDDKNPPNQQSGGEGSSDNPTGNNRGNKPSNKGGGGLTNTTPPDVVQQMNDAEKAHDAGNFSDARYSIQQALIGVELQLGRELLHSLPDSLQGLPKDSTQDRVTSTQWGWSNLTIQRVYFDNKDKQLTVTIGNNSIYSGWVQMYFSGTYTTGDGNQNAKQVRVKGYKAVITYDDSKGYTLIVPMGQTSMIVWECINFANENEVMNTANVFDIDGIKKMLGEQ